MKETTGKVLIVEYLRSRQIQPGTTSSRETADSIRCTGTTWSGGRDQEINEGVFVPIAVVKGMVPWA
jgi:hypothetical protein